MGRPTDYDPNLHPWLAETLAAAGLKDDEIAARFGKAYSTLKKWLSYPEFSAALSRGKKPANDQVKRAGFLRAIGYSYPSEEVFCAFGKVTRVKVMKHVPPDPTMIQFWLVNRDKENWKHLSHVDHSSGGEKIGPIMFVSGLPVRDPAPANPERCEGSGA